MTKLLSIISILFILESCKTTVKTFDTSDNNKIGVKSNKFRGTIFKSSYPKDKLFIVATDSINRFTPTREDIEVAETILKQQIQKLNNPRINQFSKKEYIDKNLKNILDNTLDLQMKKVIKLFISTFIGTNLL